MQQNLHTVKASRKFLDKGILKVSSLHWILSIGYREGIGTLVGLRTGKTYPDEMRKWLLLRKLHRDSPFDLPLHVFWWFSECLGWWNPNSSDSASYQKNIVSATTMQPQNPSFTGPNHDPKLVVAFDFQLLCSDKKSKLRTCYSRT